jgi:hypothetical protein
MTVIVGIAQDGIVHLGGDSAGVAGYTITTRADAKVFANGPFVFGFTTSFRMGQLIRYAWIPPEPPRAPGDLDRFMATAFIDGLREALKAGGWAAKENEREEGGTFLVGVSGRLFQIADDYQVGESTAGFDAVGAGDEIALGALHATSYGRMSAPRRLQIALEAAERFNTGVTGPFAYLSTRPPT